ncbi:MAG: universal stress protein [Synechococcales cyanobacterium]
MFDSILFAVDQSRETSHGVDLVTSLASRFHSKVLLVAVVPEDPDPQLLQATTTLVHQIALLCQEKGIPQPDYRVEQGNIPFVICDVADERGTDLIVMGNRGLLGDGQNQSVSHRVIDLAPCPVLIVP